MVNPKHDTHVVHENGDSKGTIESSRGNGLTVGESTTVGHNSVVKRPVGTGASASANGSNFNVPLELNHSVNSSNSVKSSNNTGHTDNTDKTVHNTSNTTGSYSDHTGSTPNNGVSSINASNNTNLPPNTPKQPASNTTNDPKLPKTTSKKKKHKKSKKKTPVEEDVSSKPPPLSPRRQSIMRYKTSDDKINERSYINELKSNLRTNPKQADQADQSNKTVPVREHYDLMPTTLYIDDKVTLFTANSATILSYDEQLSENDLSTSSGRLFSHGFFEIFQLHNGDVTYMACGPNFVYPLLPKLKILRIGFNEFILPLVNPERYWKIGIASEDQVKIQELENTLESLVQYRNLHFLSRKSNPKIELQNGLAHNDPHNALSSPISSNINEQPTELKSLSIIDETESNENIRSKKLHANGNTFDFHEISSSLPESPPSAPISPHPERFMGSDSFHSPIKPVHLTPGWSLNRKISNSTNMACLDISGVNDYIESTPNTIVPHANLAPINLAINSYDNYKKEIYQPKPKRATQKPNHIINQVFDEKDDAKSDSSMDSLLDEYEESISYSKSVTFRSRPPSRRPSVSSASFPNRSQYFKGPEQKDSDLIKYEEFPTTSLSEYNRVRNNASRSVRSSRSELYTSESNWMEPNLNNKAIAPDGRLLKMKSAQSMSSKKQPVDLNSTYRNIYRSITERNLNAHIDEREPRARRSSTAVVRYERGQQHISQSSQQSQHSNNSVKSQQLDASEVYKLINSSRRPSSRVSEMRSGTFAQPEQSKSGFASRLFGW